MFCLINSCSSVDLSQSLQKNVSLENLNQSVDRQISNSEQNPNTASTKNENSVRNTDEIKSPYQTKPRRKTINFSDDCFRPVVEGSKNWKLVLACAEAIETIKPEIEKAAKDNKCDSSFENLPDNSSYEVIDDDQLLTYTVKPTDSKELNVLAKKLETTLRSLFKNSDLPESNPYELKAGQLLKYQKAHYSYEYNLTFHPFSANKYLVEMRCSTGAYNLSNIYLLYDESAIPAKAQVLEFPWIKITSGEDEDLDVPKAVEKVTVKAVGGRYFNPKTKELIVFVKAYGIGDAGRYARYSFPNGKPTLEEFRARLVWSGRGYQAGDVIKSSPKTWKRYYP